MTSLIESYERRSYKNDPFFSSGVQYVTKEGVKGEEEGEGADQSDQQDDRGEDGEHYFGNGDEEILREEGNYENFMEALASLDGKKRITGSRTEGTGEFSEYNLSAHRSSKVEVGLVTYCSSIMASYLYGFNHYCSTFVMLYHLHVYL